MALTLKVEQLLESAGLITFFEDSRDTWMGLAAESHEFVSTNFPQNSLIRPDDVADALQPLLEVDEQLKNYFAAQPLRQKYWFRHFCDLILDRVWEEITQEGENEN